MKSWRIGYWPPPCRDKAANTGRPGAPRPKWCGSAPGKSGLPRPQFVLVRASFVPPSSIGHAAFRASGLKYGGASGTVDGLMSPKWKLTAYALLLILSAWFGRCFYVNYTTVTNAAAEGANAPEADSDSATNASTNGPANTKAVTNVATAIDTNSPAA